MKKEKRRTTNWQRAQSPKHTQRNGLATGHRPPSSCGAARKRTSSRHQAYQDLDNLRTDHDLDHLRTDYDLGNLWTDHDLDNLWTVSRSR